MVPDSTTVKTQCPPLLKWPGGKRKLLKEIFPLIGRFNSYYEPFVGGGALFFALHPARAYLSDANPELINVYVQVRDNVDALVGELRKLLNSEAEYYQVRGRRPRSDLGKAARMLYLARLSFNGIYRLNKSGQFNVPYGKKTHLAPCDHEHLKSASSALKSAYLQACDFEEGTQKAKAGDLVYLDPPYTVAHENNGFLKYNAKIFSWDDQVRLADLSRDLTLRGCKVLVSNAEHPSIQNLYRHMKKKTVVRHSIMAASSDFRRQIEESIYYNEV